MIVNSRIIVFVIVKRTRASSHVSCAIEAIKLLLCAEIVAFTPWQTTGSPSSVVTVNMTLRNGVVIRDCMGNTSILRNSSK